MSHLLRELVERARPACEKIAGEKWPALALAAGAFRFLAIGGSVSLTDALTEPEVAALEAAAELLETQRLARLAEALQAPGGLGAAVALKRVDGGRTLEQAIRALWASEAERKAGAA